MTCLEFEMFGLTDITNSTSLMHWDCCHDSSCHSAIEPNQTLFIQNVKNYIKYLKHFELNKGVKIIQIFGVTQICSAQQHSWVQCYCSGAVSSPVVFNITSAVVLKASDSCRHFTSDTAVCDTSLKTHTNAQKTKLHIQLGVREQFHIQWLCSTVVSITHWSLL